MAIYVTQSLPARPVDSLSLSLFMARIREGRCFFERPYWFFLGKSESWLPPFPVPSPPPPPPPRSRCSSPFPIYLLADKDRLAKSIGRNPPPAFATLGVRRRKRRTTGRTDADVNGDSRRRGRLTTRALGKAEEGASSASSETAIAQQNHCEISSICLCRIRPRPYVRPSAAATERAMWWPKKHLQLLSLSLPGAHQISPPVSSKSEPSSPLISSIVSRSASRSSPAPHGARPK